MTRALLAAFAAMALLAGCGTADNDPNLAAAAQKVEDRGSFRLAVTGTVTEASRQIEIECSGEADFAAERLRLSCDYGPAGAMEVIALGTSTYMRGDVLGFGGSEDKWVELTDDESITDEIAPQRLLAMLRSASQTTERVGVEQVRGEETVRYLLVVDCEQADVPECPGETATVAVWVDDDGLVRRIAFQDGTSPYTIEFFDFGADVVIEAPATDDVVDIEEWSKPQPCRLDAGAPLTGADVTAALKRRGLEVGYDDQCAGSVVAIVEVRDHGPGNGAFAHCQVAQTDSGGAFNLRPEGMTFAGAANVKCFYTEELTSKMDEVVADLKRQARE